MRFVCVSEKMRVGSSKDGSIKFILKYQDRGIYGKGRTWNLSAIYGNVTKDFMAEFCVRDDGHDVYKECEQGRIWTSMKDIICTAEKMANNLLTAYGLE